MVTESAVIPHLGLNNQPLRKVIHVHQATARANKRDGTNNPACIVQARGGPYRCHSVEINGPAYMMQGEISCGATVWLVTYAEVRAIVYESNDLCTAANEAAMLFPGN